jgi:hypothetical protein
MRKRYDWDQENDNPNKLTVSGHHVNLTW